MITAAIKCLTASYSNYKDQATSPEQERTVSERLCQHLVGLSETHRHTHTHLFLFHLIYNLFSLHSRHLKTLLHLNGTVLSRMG